MQYRTAPICVTMAESNELAWDASGLRMVPAVTDGVEFRDGNGRPLGLGPRPLSAAGTAVALSPDGKTAVVGDKNGGVTIWNAALGSLVRPVVARNGSVAHDGTVWAVSFTPNGNDF